ncbi:uncharacterized protein At3g28850-like [Zingiber officinale]|uniref:Glutaredoxin domain-containing protein n=1 Tax=Zingiber officinale TaxID=94328 RepID=A0A8J5GAV4_ZINOF|nr:uncharacterized protein At3g28850-like [Zingiber officinale]KAG6499378.1 hypothetical protein ZIOFF_039144 [Zingiber officinale]
MGCAVSKQPGSGRWFGRSKSLPVHLARGGRQRSGGGHHAVILTSSTFGALRLDRGDNSSDDEATAKVSTDLQAAVSMAAVKASCAREIGLCTETWSEMIERRIPKTPTVTPPNEPEVINASELMAGLEDASPLLLPPAAHHRSFSSHTTRDAHFSSPDSEFTTSYSPKLEFMNLSHDDSIFSDFDPEILSIFREAVNQSHSALPPLKPYKKEEEEAEEEDEEDNKHPSLSIVRARIDEFQQKIDAKKATRNPNFAKMAPSCKRPPGGEGKVVLYFTSLRGIRQTYEDCRAMDTILKGYGVRIDERDVSMHAGFKEELVGTLGPGYRLPRVFADCRYLGGSDEVRQLHEEGRLGKLLECCEMARQGKGDVGGCGGGGDAGCEGCGDLRFLPCEICSGSCKVYVEEDQEEGGELGGGFRRCPECNENGLVRCLLCR